jgi:hypothetical protein
MRRWSVLLVATSFATTAAHGQDSAHVHPGAPYAAMQDRTIKALSGADVDALLAGEGVGLALAAELNGYPGPRHVLELADALGLTPAQRAATDSIRVVMLEDARRLGQAIIEAERALDRAFAAGTVTAPALRSMTADVGRLRADLRATHLAAHLAVRALLSEHQIHQYGGRRGYGGGH